MKKVFIMLVALTASVFLFTSFLFSKEAPEEKSGEALFKEHCSPCHPGGGNILSPQKTLHKKDREANNIKTAEDIVKKMRNPGPAPTHPGEWSGMKIFDEKTVPNEDALKIADYILKTFE